DAVEQQRRRADKLQRGGILQRPVDQRGIGPRVQLGVETVHVQPDGRGVVAQRGAEVLRRQIAPLGLVSEQLVVHRPKLPLSGGGFAGLKRERRFVVGA